MFRGTRDRIEIGFERYGRAVARRPWVPIASCALLALGLAVDDTIHFIHVYRREFEHCGDAEEAVRRTLTSTGRANLIACVVLSSGFFIFLAASMQNLAAFGLLTGFAFLAALVIELLVTLALLVTAAVGGKRAPESS